MGSKLSKIKRIFAAMTAENFPFNVSRSVMQPLSLPLFEIKELEVYVKRDDLIHSVVSGNKWRKLKYNLAQARQMKSKGILTFGGAFSNHLVATAAACRELGFRALGFVRGDELGPESNETLRKCKESGMELVFLDRLTYGMRNDYEYLKELKNDHPNFYVIPEGGSNYYGIIGCQEIWGEIPFVADHLFLALGTGTTACGLLSGNTETRVHVVPVLKGFDTDGEMKKLFGKLGIGEDMVSDYLENCEIHKDFHFGGYARSDRELRDFIRMVYSGCGLPLDHVYTAKAFYAMYKWIEEREDLAGQKIVFLHTGGLQGSSYYSESSQ